MPQETDRAARLLMIVTPNFNMLATTGLIDPMRAVNHLSGTTHFRWIFASLSGGAVMASNGLSVETIPLKEVAAEVFDIVVVSSIWSAESPTAPLLLVALRCWASQGILLGALDSGSLILAEAGLLRNQRATIHYEHIDSLGKLHGDVEITEGIFVLEENCFTCCGGVAAVDMGLELVRARCGNALANAAARYIFHPVIRPEDSPQNPPVPEPPGHTTPRPCAR
jgi:transcriptional regulator GlxA family with amidase domain